MISAWCSCGLFATERTVDLIVREYERRTGKILLVVNSYVQAQEVQRTLETALRKVNCPAQVCRMISDAVSSEKCSGNGAPGEVSRFAGMKEEILIAPAMAIERGHNIVDEYGHSALCAVFSWCGRWLFLTISSRRAASSMDLWNPTVIGATGISVRIQCAHPAICGTAVGQDEQKANRLVWLSWIPKSGKMWLQHCLF